MSQRHSTAGFNLIETMVTIALLTLVIGAIYGVSNLSQKAYREGEVLSEITQNGRVILERMAREIRQASKIATELPETEINATSTIMFENGHIEEPYHYIRYFQDEGSIKREAVGFYRTDDVLETLIPFNAGSDLAVKVLEESQVIGEHLSDLKFFGSGKTVYIVLILEKQDKTLRLDTNVFCRNL